MTGLKKILKAGWGQLTPACLQNCLPEEHILSTMPIDEKVLNLSILIYDVLKQ